MSLQTSGTTPSSCNLVVRNTCEAVILVTELYVSSRGPDRGKGWTWWDSKRARGQELGPYRAVDARIHWPTSGASCWPRLFVPCVLGLLRRSFSRRSILTQHRSRICQSQSVTSTCGSSTRTVATRLAKPLFGLRTPVNIETDDLGACMFTGQGLLRHGVLETMPFRKPKRWRNRLAGVI